MLSSKYRKVNVAPIENIVTEETSVFLPCVEGTEEIKVSDIPYHLVRMLSRGGHYSPDLLVDIKRAYNSGYLRYQIDQGLYRFDGEAFVLKESSPESDNLLIRTNKITTQNNSRQIQIDALEKLQSSLQEQLDRLIEDYDKDARVGTEIERTSQEIDDIIRQVKDLEQTPDGSCDQEADDPKPLI